MSSATINVSLFNSVTRKVQLVSLPRDMTIADLQSIAPGKKTVTFSVNGCMPAGSSSLGDLHDTCAKNGELQVVFTPQVHMGCPCAKSESW